MDDNNTLDQINEIKIFHHFAARLTYRDNRLKFLKNSDNINPSEKITADYEIFKNIINKKIINLHDYKNNNTVFDFTSNDNDSKILMDILKRKNQLLSSLEAGKLYTFKAGDFENVHLLEKDEMNDVGTYNIEVYFFLKIYNIKGSKIKFDPVVTIHSILIPTGDYSLLKFKFRRVASPENDIVALGKNFGLLYNFSKEYKNEANIKNLGIYLIQHQFLDRFNRAINDNPFGDVYTLGYHTVADISINPVLFNIISPDPINRFISYSSHDYTTEDERNKTCTMVRFLLEFFYINTGFLSIDGDEKDNIRFKISRQGFDRFFVKKITASMYTYYEGNSTVYFFHNIVVRLSAGQSLNQYLPGGGLIISHIVEYLKLVIDSYSKFIYGRRYREVLKHAPEVLDEYNVYNVVKTMIHIGNELNLLEISNGVRDLYLNLEERLNIIGIKINEEQRIYGCLSLITAILSITIAVLIGLRIIKF